MKYLEGRWLLSEIMNEISYNENSINAPSTKYKSASTVYVHTCTCTNISTHM